jgi:NhaP-type Na+/H+ and K+/H+ antiporter
VFYILIVMQYLSGAIFSSVTFNIFFLPVLVLILLLGSHNPPCTAKCQT